MIKATTPMPRLRYRVEPVCQTQLDCDLKRWRWKMKLKLKLKVRASFPNKRGGHERQSACPATYAPVSVMVSTPAHELSELSDGSQREVPGSTPGWEHYFRSTFSPQVNSGLSSRAAGLLRLAGKGHGWKQPNKARRLFSATLIPYLFIAGGHPAPSHLGGLVDITI